MARYLHSPCMVYPSCVLLASASASIYQSLSKTYAEKDELVQQPSFLGTGMRKSNLIIQNNHRKVTLSDMVLLGGSKHVKLTQDISKIIGISLANSEIKRFADGEVSIQINESIQGKNVFIIQSCVAPVNDSIMELLLSVSCAKRAAAGRVIAVIPYFGYKHHR